MRHGIAASAQKRRAAMGISPDHDRRPQDHEGYARLLQRGVRPVFGREEVAARAGTLRSRRYLDDQFRAGRLGRCVQRQHRIPLDGIHVVARPTLQRAGAVHDRVELVKETPIPRRPHGPQVSSEP